VKQGDKEALLGGS